MASKEVPSDDPRQKALRQALQLLSEHYDSVQVFVTYMDGNDTAAVAEGVGNFHARRGMVHSWTLHCDQEDKDEGL